MQLATQLLSMLATVCMIGANGTAFAAAPDGPKLVQQTCGTCHTLGKDEKSGEGPNLYGIVGRKAGAAPGFRYSPVFVKALSGKIWTPQLLDRWLANTEEVAPGSGMAIFIDSPAQRQAIIDYLAQR